MILSEVIKGSQLHFSSLSSALSNQDIIDVIGVSVSNTVPKSLVVQIVKIRNGRISSRIGYTQTLPDDDKEPVGIDDKEPVGIDDDLDPYMRGVWLDSTGEIMQKILESYYSNPSSEGIQSISSVTCVHLLTHSLAHSLIHSLVHSNIRSNIDSHVS